MRPSGLYFFISCGCFFVVNGSRSCSWSNKTVEKVPSCPTNKTEVEERKMIKNCSTLANEQNCTEPRKFLYHCVINELETSLVEVCAPMFVIHEGYCAEYNIVGAVIQPHYNLKCSNVSNETTPCPDRYNSTDAYLYGWCYAAVQTIPSTVQTIPSTVRTLPSSNNIVRTISTTDSYLNSGKTNSWEWTPEKHNGVTTGIYAFVLIIVLIIVKSILP